MTRIKMAELGSIWDATEGPAGGRRGPDLAWKVAVPRGACGHPDGWLVEVPQQLGTDDGEVARACGSDEVPGRIRLHLPEGAPAAFRLRLRGQGGVVAGGVPGDLYLEVGLTDEPMPAVVGSSSSSWARWVAVGALGAGAVGLAMC